MLYLGGSGPHEKIMSELILANTSEGVRTLCGPGEDSWQRATGWWGGGCGASVRTGAFYPLN